MQKHHIRAALLAAALPALHACMALTVPFSQQREVAGQEVTRLAALRLSPGRTTRSEVVARLGKPSLQWSAERTLVYTWSARESRAVLVSNPGRPLGFERVHDGTRAHQLALQFDADDRLLRVRNVLEDTVGHQPASLHQWVVDGLRARAAPLEPRVSTRTDVHARLGEPRYRRDDSSAEVYEWADVNLLLQFAYDAHGRVTDKREIAKPVVLSGDYAPVTVGSAD